MCLLRETGVNGVLADEMGLGKTVQTIAFFALLRHRREGAPPRYDVQWREHQSYVLYEEVDVQVILWPARQIAESGASRVSYMTMRPSVSAAEQCIHDIGSPSTLSVSLSSASIFNFS